MPTMCKIEYRETFQPKWRKERNDNGSQNATWFSNVAIPKVKLVILPNRFLLFKCQIHSINHLSPQGRIVRKGIAGRSTCVQRCNRKYWVLPVIFSIVILQQLGLKGKGEEYYTDEQTHCPTYSIKEMVFLLRALTNE